MPTLREVPAEAETVSHRLLLRGGFIKKLSAGVYSYLPLGLRVLDKVRTIVREEANRIGAHELLMPTLVPFELLEETGRDKVQVLYRTQDRTDRTFALGFTHEEVITDIVRSFVQSYRELPVCLYQIQTKFRDEPRPRAGLMRGKEFLMFDAYSFDVGDEECQKVYDQMAIAYQKMFRRMGLQTLICDAEAGDIGGGMNQEFMVIADAGEDSVLQDSTDGRAANAERCDIGGEFALIAKTDGSFEKVHTPNSKTVEEVTQLLNVDAKQLVKTLLFESGETKIAALIRGDRELNEFKLARRLGVSKVEMMGAAKVREITGAEVGFAGPVGLKNCIIIADNEIMEMTDFVVGANQTDYHLKNVCHGRDFAVEKFDDIRLAVHGDASATGGILSEVRGIEVGHIFNLGTKYSGAMSAEISLADGSSKPIWMGCYGLGIGRSMQSIVEVSHDENGMIWPVSVAPFEVNIVVVNRSDESQLQAATQLYDELLELGIEVFFDDRVERAGAKFKDSDLIGFPLRIVSGRNILSGNFEAKWRNEPEAFELPIHDAAAKIANWINEKR